MTTLTALTPELLASVNLDAIREALKEADVTFGNRSGAARLVELAVENSIAVEDMEGKILIDEEGNEPGDEDDENQDDGEEGDGAVTDEAEEEEGGNIVPLKYRQKYGTPQHCGDQVALVFKDFVTVTVQVGEKAVEQCSETALVQVCDQNGVAYDRWDHLKNIGMKRMNLGNILRGKIKRGERVQIGETVWEAREPEKEGDETASKMG